MGAEFYSHCSLAQFWKLFLWRASTEFIRLHTPRLGKVIHIKLEIPVASDQVISLVSIVVAT